jgi:hypothetical protein
MSSGEIHPQLSNNGHAVDGVLVGAHPIWLVGTIHLERETLAQDLNQTLNHTQGFF